MESASSGGVERAADAERPGLEDMGIDHGGADIVVPEEFLDGPDIGAGLEEVGGETVPEGMATGGLEDAGVADRDADGALKGALGGVVASDDAGAGVGGESSGGEEILPAELAIGARILLCQSVGEIDAAVSLGEVASMEGLDAIHLPAQGLFERAGQEGDAILPALAVADEDVALAEVDVLDPEPEAFHQPQPGSIEEAGHQPGRAVELIEDGVDLVAGQDGGQALGPTGGDDAGPLLERLTENLAIEEKDGAEGLILGRGGDIPLDGQVGQERFQLGDAHLPGMALAVEEDESPDPIDVGIFRPDAVMQDADPIPHLVEQPGHVRPDRFGRLFPLCA